MAGLDPNISGQLELGESGDGSDQDLEELAQQAADLCEQIMDEKCSNNGMKAMAQMMQGKIQQVAEDMLGGTRPNMEDVWTAIDQVHSYDTARSCMSEAVSDCGELLNQAFEKMVEHEAAEGNYQFEGNGVLRG
jgi:hypothetical protein